MIVIHLVQILAVFFDFHHSSCEQHAFRRSLSKAREPSEFPSAFQFGQPAKTPDDVNVLGRVSSIERIKTKRKYFRCKDETSCKTSRTGILRVSRRVRVKRSLDVYCNDELSCMNRCSQTRQFTRVDKLGCYCDDDCDFFQDCCADFEAFCVKTIDVTSAPSILGNFGQLPIQTESPKISPNKSLEMKGLWSCFRYKGMISEIKGIWMIGSCPKSWPKDDIFHKCTNLSAANTITKDNYQYLPVYTSDGTVYHNRLCAQCNGEDLNKTKSYDLMLSPSCNNSVINVNSSRIGSGKNCTLEGWKPADGDPRRYCLNMISTCNISNSAKECTEGKVAVVSISKYIYKNKFCAVCNSLLKGLMCGPNATIFPLDPRLDPLHDAMNFFPPAITLPSKRSCDSGMVYDIFAKQCRETLTAKSRNTTKNCSYVWVLIEDGEFTVLKNQSVFVKKSRMVYETSRYIWKNNTLYICENFSKSYQVDSSMKYDDYFALGLMTYICMTISIICLIFVLITYSLFSELRTPPGINLMNLSISIFLAQLFWMLGSDQANKPTLCFTIAALRHYFFLVSFVWSSIIAFDTWRAFTAKGRRSRSKVKIMYHMAVGWLSVAIYVAICLSLDLTETVSIGYHGDKVCWMSNAFSVLYFFAVPVALLLVSNTVLFCLTARAIYQTQAQARFAVSDRDRKKSFGIYVRIASAMGFTWIFGFIAPFGLGFLWYPFVFFNSLQGVYIAVAFVFNKRVMRLYKNHFSNSVADNATRNISSLQMSNVQTSTNGNR